MFKNHYITTQAKAHSFSSCRSFWREFVAEKTNSLPDALGQDKTLDLLHYAASTDGWCDEYEYLVLRLLKPDSPLGKEREA